MFLFDTSFLYTLVRSNPNLQKRRNVNKASRLYFSSCKKFPEKYKYPLVKSQSTQDFEAAPKPNPNSFHMNSATKVASETEKSKTNNHSKNYSFQILLLTTHFSILEYQSPKSRDNIRNLTQTTEIKNKK